MAIMPY